MNCFAKSPGGLEESLLIHDEAQAVAKLIEYHVANNRYNVLVCRMFRFDFEMENEATNPESETSCTNEEDSEPELEPFHEVEMISELPKDTPEITELLGVRHFSDVLKEDDLYHKTETAHTDLIPRVRFPIPAAVYPTILPEKRQLLISNRH